MTTYTSAELDAMDRKAAEWMGLVLVERVRFEDRTEETYRPPSGLNCTYREGWRPTRDLNQVAVMEERLTDEERLAYLSNIQGWAEVSGLEMWWAFRHAPVPICVKALLKVRKT